MTTTLLPPPFAPSPRPRYLAELRGWLARCTAQFRAARCYPAASHFEVGAQILDDEIATRRAEAGRAHRAEVHDLEARRLLADVLADGTVDDFELPALRQSLALIERSAADDHALAESLTLPAA